MVDTRSKVAEPGHEEGILARIDSTWLVITGYFDPLTAAHARRIEQLADGSRHVLVIVHDPPHPLLPLQARATLLAALHRVDAVIPATGGDAALWAARFPARQVRSEEEGDLQRREQFVRHVRQRHSA